MLLCISKPALFFSDAVDHVKLIKLPTAFALKDIISTGSVTSSETKVVTLESSNVAVKE